MSSQNVPTRKLQIHSFSDLKRGLLAGDTGTQVGLLNAIGQNPQKAISYQEQDDDDLVGVLVELLEKSPEPMRQAVYAALSKMDDTRLVDIFCDRLQVESKANIRIFLTEWVSKKEPELLYKKLWSEDLQMVRVVANHLVEARPEEARLRLRISLASDREAEWRAPSPSEHMDLWLDELRGPFARRSRFLAETLGEEAWNSFSRCLDELPDSAKVWMVEWGGRIGASAAGKLVVLLLAGESAFHKAALMAARELELSLEPAVLTPLLSSGDPLLRSLAIELGAPVENPLQQLHCETSTQVRLVLLSRFGAMFTIPELLSLQGRADHRVSSALAAALIKKGENALDSAKELAVSDDPHEKALGCRVLMSLGEYEWLESQFLTV